MEGAWQRLEPRLAAYRLLVPGSPAFICQPEACTAHCCHAFSVNLGEREVDRMSRATGMQMVEFLELDEGEPITLPMAQPYLLARRDGRCRFLGEGLGCDVYAGRPNACRLYPHFVVFWDEAAQRPLFGGGEDLGASVERVVAGELGEPLPLLLGHSECPGFTGPPIAERDWRELLQHTYQLQFEAV